MKVVDLGCGTGESTPALADALPERDVTGLDSSPQMLEKAATYAGPNLRYEQGDLSELTGHWDLIYSNAAIQCCEEHEKLIPYLYTNLKPNGQRCVQIPSSQNHISHQLIRETANEEPLHSILLGLERQAPVLSIEEYAEVLFF